MEIRAFCPALGAEIMGVDLARPLVAVAIDAIRRALGEFGVVFFRDQQLTPEQHLAFAQHFGGVNLNRFFKAVDGYPAIAEVRKDPDQQQNIGGNWHRPQLRPCPGHGLDPLCTGGP